jgi:hypothetical protein
MPTALLEIRARWANLSLMVAKPKIELGVPELDPAYVGAIEKERDQSRLFRDLAAIRLRCAALPALDERKAEDIIGYDENGLPVAEERS